MTRWSVGVAVLGVSWTAALLVHLSRREPRQRPERLWFLELASLAPAWLMAFVSLLGLASERGPKSAPSRLWILFSGAALLGVILTEASVRRLHESGRALRPVTYWLLGVAALLPAWGIALLGWREPR